MILTPLQKLPKNVEDLGKLIVAKGLKKLPKVKKNRPIWSHCFYGSRWWPYSIDTIHMLILSGIKLCIYSLLLIWWPSFLIFFFEPRFVCWLRRIFDGRNDKWIVVVFFMMPLPLLQLWNRQKVISFAAKLSTILSTSKVSKKSLNGFISKTMDCIESNFYIKHINRIQAHKPIYTKSS